VAEAAVKAAVLAVVAQVVAGREDVKQAVAFRFQRVITLLP
jgi:hypothetical protein|tara:strand:+ start:1041 stop:1163 length:123 start_codon:yes stop_codon:yes gene_type:complete